MSAEVIAEIVDKVCTDFQKGSTDVIYSIEEVTNAYYSVLLSVSHQGQTIGRSIRFYLAQTYPDQLERLCRRAIQSAIAHIEINSSEIDASQKWDCQYYNHTRQRDSDLRCSLHPDPNKSCQGCLDYEAHPLWFSLNPCNLPPIIVPIENRLYKVCNTFNPSAKLILGADMNSQDIAIALLTVWVEFHVSPPANCLYFFGDRNAYQIALKILERPFLPSMWLPCINQEHRFGIFGT